MKKRRRVRRIWKNMFVFIVLVMIVLGGFRVHALASDLESVPTQKVYTSVTIHDGDTLWGFAEEYCSSDRPAALMAYTDELKEINHIVNTYALKPGASLIVYREVPVQ